MIHYSFVIDVPLFICNDEVYGFIMVPLENDETIAEDMQRLTNTKVEMLGKFEFVCRHKINELNELMNNCINITHTHTHSVQRLSAVVRRSEGICNIS